MLNHVDNSFNLNFEDVYTSHFGKIEASLRKLDILSGFKRSSDQVYELTQDFFANVWAKNVLRKFDPRRAKSKDPILAFLYNFLRNFHRSIRNKENKLANTKKQIKEISSLGLCSHSTLYGSTHEEDNGFCHDIKKVTKAFLKSLKGEEKRAWKFFIYDEKPAEEVARSLGISSRTSFRLKDSINHKAKIYLKGYYAGNLTLN